MRIRPCELRAEQKDLSGVVNPQQHHDKGRSGPEAGRDTGLSDVGANQKFADDEQQRGDCRPKCV